MGWSYGPWTGVAVFRDPAIHPFQDGQNVPVRHSWPSLEGPRGPGRPPQRRGLVRTPACHLAVVAGCSFLVLTLLVRLNKTVQFDAAVRELFRPDNRWGPAQMRVEVVVEGLRPVVVGVAALALASAIGRRRRSIQPLLITLGVVALTVLLTAVTKASLARPDPVGLVQGLGGSYPSGHTAAIVACTGVIVMLTGPGARSLWLIPIVLGSAMAIALLVQAVHWASDVLGGALLATATLAAACALGVAGRSNDSDADPGSPHGHPVGVMDQQQADQPRAHGEPGPVAPPPNGPCASVGAQFGEFAGDGGIDDHAHPTQIRRIDE